MSLLDHCSLKFRSKSRLAPHRWHSRPLRVFGKVGGDRCTSRRKPCTVRATRGDRLRHRCGRNLGRSWLEGADGSNLRTLTRDCSGNIAARDHKQSGTTATTGDQRPLPDFVWFSQPLRQTCSLRNSERDLVGSRERLQGTATLASRPGGRTRTGSCHSGLRCTTGSTSEGPRDAASAS